jgi:SIR2-like protein
MPTAIQPSHYNLIVKRIRDGRCVPFLGAGVNISSEGYQGLPLAYDVALHMVKALTNLNKNQLEVLTKNASDDIRLRLAQAIAGLSEEQMHNLTEAAIEQHLKKAGPLPSLLRASLPDLARIALHVEVETDFDNLMDLVHEILPDKEYQPSPLLQTLALLPFKVLVTTNYDRLLERAFGDTPYELVVQPINGFAEQDQNNLQKQLSAPKGPIIYKIHGSFRDNGIPAPTQEINRLILTEEDYIQFLSIVGRQDLGMPTLISEKMINGTILFLGYSLQDWDFRTIYKTLIEPLPEKQRPKSFAIQKNPPDFWVRYWESKKVTILDVDLYEFATELQKYWQNENDD